MMTKLLYSPSCNGFFVEGVSTAVPGDAVPISARLHARLMQAQSEGAAIVARDGKPVSVFPKPDRLALRAAIKGEASRRILSISPLWRQANDATAFALGTAGDAEHERLGRITAIREASNLIEEQLAATADRRLATFPIADHPLWPETD